MNLTGYFRIAVTEGSTWNEVNPSKNHMYVLDSELNIVGRLENLARGERIYSVRFMGNKAYMVTFVETDPLFVIDLSSPDNPTLLGELKIPGFSNYLHPYDETHIIGFGQDTETVTDSYGRRTITTGMKMALFDVSDVNDPKEMYMMKIGDRYTYSEILNNHKALLFSKEKNIIAFPITIYKEDDWAFGEIYYNDYTTFQGAVVYGLDLENGFSEKGRITHRKAENNDDYAFQYDKQVDRIVYIGDTLFTASRGLIKATNLNTYEEIGSVKIEVEENYYPIMPLDMIVN